MTREFYWVRVKGEGVDSLAEVTTNANGVRHFMLPRRFLPRYEGQVDILARVPAPGEPLSPGDEAAVLDRAIERMGWPEIRAYEAELARGQDVAEDAGGFMLRALRRLFGLPPNRSRIQTYRDAARALVRRAA